MLPFRHEEHFMPVFLAPFFPSLPGQLPFEHHVHPQVSHLHFTGGDEYFEQCGQLGTLK